jgi:nitrogen fixation protein NifQ
MGLDRMRFGALVACYFPGADVELFGARCDPAAPCADCTPVPSDEFDDLVQLLLDHRSDDAEQTEWLSYAVASGCMGGDHLYQDMGLPDRQALSDLMARHLGMLTAKNSANMKWKKFLYKQLCDRAEVGARSAPAGEGWVGDHKWVGPPAAPRRGALAGASGRAPRETQSA